MNSNEIEHAGTYNCMILSYASGICMVGISFLVFITIGLPTIIQNNGEFIIIYQSWLSLAFIIIGLLILAMTYLLCHRNRE